MIGHLFLGSLVLTSFISEGQGMRCYKCHFIEGIRKDPELNPDCVDNVGSGSVQLEEGAACIKVQGEHGHHRFILRRAFHPDKIYNRADRIFLPGGQVTTNCHAVNVTVIRVGYRIINSIDFCEVCTDQDACNTSRVNKVNHFFWLIPLCGLFSK